MRVLVTGVTAQQCGRTTRLDHVKFAEIIARVLRDLGHDVQLRRLESPDEDLNRFDLALVGLAPFMARGTYYAFDVVNVVSRARREGYALAFFVDDWKFGKVVSDGKVICDRPDVFLRPEIGRRHQAWADAHHAEIRAFGYALTHRPWPPTLVPAFTWGDHAALSGRLPKARPRLIDPTAYVETPLVGAGQDRQRRWVLGALHDHSVWVEKLGLSWPVQRYGAKAQQLKERDLVGMYRAARGVLAPRYGHSGSGWWRVRFQHAADTGCVLLADPHEVHGIAGPYDVPAEIIEMLPDTELDRLAAAQKTALYDHAMSRDQVQSVVAQLLEEAMDART